MVLRSQASKGTTLGLSVSAYSSDSDSDNDNAGGADALAYESAQFMRNLAKSNTSAFDSAMENHDDDSDDDVTLGVTSSDPDARLRQLDNVKSTAGFMKMLEEDLDFDVDLNDAGEVMEKVGKRRKSSPDGNGSDNDNGNGNGNDDDNDNDNQNARNDDERSDDDNRSESGSEIEFGAQAVSDGIPVEQYEKTHADLSAMVALLVKERKEHKDLKKKQRKIDQQLKEFTLMKDEDKLEIDELEGKLAEAISKQGQGISAAGGGGGAGASSALEEQRRKQREDARKALFSGADDDDDEEFHVKIDDLSFVKEFLKRLQKRINKLMPLAADIRSVQGHFGSSVASFFAFYRWIIITNVWAGTLCLVFLILHVYSLYQNSWKNSEDGDLATFYVLLPGFMAISSYGTVDRYQYLALVVLLTGILFFDAIRKWVTEDQNSKNINSIEAEQANIKFAKQFLCCWDFGLVKESDVDDLQCTVGSNMTTLLQVERERGKTLERTAKEKAIMYARRFLGIIIYLACLLASWATILYLTAQQNDLAGKLLESGIQGAEYFSGSIVPGCVTAINSIMPMLIDKITAFEKWDTEKTTVKVLLLKMYASKILNVLIQFGSYLLLADPIMFTSSSTTYFGFDTARDAFKRYVIRKNVATDFQPAAFTCRLDQVAAGLVQLLTVDFVVSKIIAITLPYINLTVAKVRKKPFKRDEFQVAKKMVNLLYFQGLVFLSMPFAPLFTFVVLIFQYWTFKFEKYMLFKFGMKPKKEWKAQDAGGFFIKFYLITIIVTGMLAVYLFLSGKTFAKNEDVLDDILVQCEDLTNAGLELTAGCTVLNSTEIKNIASAKCGPFTNVTSAWMMVEEDISAERFSLLSEIVYTILTQVGIVWFIVLFYYLQLSFTESTLGVAETSIAEKERAFESANQAAEAKIRRLNKKVKNLEAAAKTS